LKKDLDFLKIQMDKESIDHIDNIDFLENESHVRREENEQMEKERKIEKEETENLKNKYSFEQSVLSHLVEEQKSINEKLEKSKIELEITLNLSGMKIEELQNRLDSMKINLMGESDQKKVALEERDLAKKQNEKTLSEYKTLQQEIESILNEKYVYF
jgi:hypothetical protein